MLQGLGLGFGSVRSSALLETEPLSDRITDHLRPSRQSKRTSGLSSGDAKTPRFLGTPAVAALALNARMALGRWGLVCHLAPLLLRRVDAPGADTWQGNHDQDIRW